MKQVCKKCETKFVLDQDDLSFYEKMKVPLPKVCPDCRFMMRLFWRNETTLYAGRKCDMCGKGIISMYNPKLPYKIYCYDCFYSEKWHPKDYAKKFDITQPFLKQLEEFFTEVPRVNLGISLGFGPNINSEYVNMATGCKNAYMVFNTTSVENVMYAKGVKDVKDSADIYFGGEFERCYECVNIQKSSGVAWGRNVVSCVDCFFILNASNLINCFGCVNLRNKSYCWFNEQLTPEQYNQKLKEVLGSYEKMEEAKNKFIEFSLKFPRRENNNLKVVDSTGDYLFECKNVKDSFEITNGENCKYAFASKNIKDSSGTLGYGVKSEKLLEVVATGLSSNVIGTYWAENCTNIFYSFDIRNCQDCIGCNALKNGKYCIFNYEYSKEEYEKLKEHIEKELIDLGIHGLIMPQDMAPFAYNESIAQDNFPLTKEEALARGFRWEDDIQKTEGKETLKREEIRDNIMDTPDSITSEILACISCNRNYKITEQELVFYRKMKIPIPRQCFYCRHRNRIKDRGAYKFWNRNCAKCKKEITTNYSPERPEVVYCEKCYQQEVY
jgi:hypothetical protein